MSKGKEIFLEWLNRAEKAFEANEIEFGTVEFECPECGGKAWFTKTYTPDRSTHKVTVRASCENNCTNIMN